MAALLKNLYNREYISLLTDALVSVHPTFNKEEFTSTLFTSNWKQKELKQRMRAIAIHLNIYLPKEYKESIAILKSTFKLLPQGLGLENTIFQDYVEVYGKDDLDTSLSALECFTISSTSEFAIRQFILTYPEKTMLQMQKWAKHENHEVRRLASEGCRPRLPWAIALKDFIEDPQKIINILEVLLDDESIYVRKSVANSLNDISKDNPHLIKALVPQWYKENKQREWLLKHACRTLLKKSDIETLELFGFHGSKHIDLHDFQIDKTVLMGEKLNFSFKLDSSKELGKIRVEFVLSFLRKNEVYNKKVFHLAQGIYKSNSKEFSKYYSFKPISTRSYYAGMQELSIQVNGRVLATQQFLLSD